MQVSLNQKRIRSEKKQLPSETFVGTLSRNEGKFTPLDNVSILTGSKALKNMAR